MVIRAADPKKSHEGFPECPSRLALDPTGHWYCVDCGMTILTKLIEVEPKQEHGVLLQEVNNFTEYKY